MNESSVARKFRGIIRFSVLTLGLLHSTVTFAQPERPELDLAALEQALQQTEDKLQSVRRSIDQTRFDPEQWLDRLDYDSTAILAAVGDEIVFQPYQGVLRGVAGTLRSRAGNSADQALLLAWLLKSAGFDARIARGTLAESEARGLLALGDPPTSDPSLDYLLPVIEREFGPEAVASTATLNWSDSKLGKRAAQTSATLLETLEGAGVSLTTRPATGRLVAITRDYFWVQHRSGPAAPWVDAHPAFGRGEPPSGLEPSEYFADEIPADLQHRLIVTAHIDQRFAGEIRTHALMAPFDTPVANLDGKALSYRNHPDGLTPATLGDLESAVDETTLLLPVINDARAPGAMAFDLSGRTVDPMALGSGASGLFSTLAERTEQATATVADPEDPKDVVALESMWLEFTFVAPGGAETRVRRYILPPRGDQARDNKAMVWALMTEHDYVVNAGRHPVEYLADRYLEAGVAGGDWFRALAHKFSDPDAETPMPKGAVPRDFGPLAQFRIMDAFPFAVANIHSFRDRPNLLGIRRGFRGPDVAFVGVDVVSNKMSQLRSVDGELHDDPEAALRRGVWDTAVEAVPVLSLSVDAVRRANSVDALDAATSQGIALEVVKPGQNDRLAALDLPAAARESIRGDLDNGFVIVMPKRKPDGAAMQAWWKVHPDSGETLGLTADGFGQDIVWYAMDLALTGIGIATAVGGMAKCTEMTDMVEGLCCLVETHVNNVAGLGFGGIMGATLGTATSVMFSIVDLQTQAASEALLGEAQGLMPQAALNCDQLQTTQW